jgi:hypothetical protein
VKKIILASVALSVSVLLSGCAVLYPNWGTDQNPSTSMSPSPSMDSESPTPSDSASQAPQKIKAEINLIESMVDSSAGTILVVAEVLNAVENGGKCVITFSSGSATKSVSVKAEANASSTQCFPAYLPTSGLPKGKGSITVTYESDKYLGTSESFAVTIP